MTDYVSLKPQTWTDYEYVNKITTIMFANIVDSVAGVIARRTPNQS